MKSKRLVLIVLGAVAVAFYAGNALATDPVNFSGTTLAKATFGEIDSHVVAEPDHAGVPGRCCGQSPPR